MTKTNNKYLELKNLWEEEVNKLPLHFAFGTKQLEEKAQELGFTNIDELKENVIGIGGGGFILKKDEKLVDDTFKRQHEEKQKLIDLDDDFLLSVFEYELGNHEYIITYDINDTLRSLAITKDEYLKSERMQKIMQQAITNYKNDMEKLGW